MRCPKCNSIQDRVIDSRAAKDGLSIRRRRECLDCSARFTTYEEIERLELRVTKRDGRHEPFDRQKLMGSFEKACEKRPISLDSIEQMVEEVIQHLETDQRREVPTKDIGLLVMEKLHGMDAVAYVRYASVYREFQEIGDFLEEIQTMGRKTAKTPAQPELFTS